MAYEVPTPTDIKARFPEFSDVADLTITPMIEAASIQVDDKVWTETDYFYAIMYLAAHYLAMHQRAAFLASTGGSVGGSEGEVVNYVSEIKFEDFDIKFGQDKRQTSTTSGGAGSATGGSVLLTSSPYGLLFLELRDRNVVPFAILGGVPLLP